MTLFCVDQELRGSWFLVALGYWNLTLPASIESSSFRSGEYSYLAGLVALRCVCGAEKRGKRCCNC